MFSEAYVIFSVGNLSREFAKTSHRPLSCLSKILKTLAPGYMLTSMMCAALFAAAYPACWKKHTQCSKRLLGSLTYSQIAGIIFGMLTVGFIADRIGRKRGSILTASIMFVGE